MMIKSNICLEFYSQEYVVKCGLCFIVVDVDECLLPDACSSGLVCKNTYGSYRCECSPGFTQAPSSQSDVNPVCNGEKRKAILLMFCMQFLGRY